MKVLVADDDALIRKLLIALLTKLGHEAEAVENGDSAWSVLEGPNPPELAILDWMMPGLNGPELCRRLRSLGGRKRTYVLLLSAKGDKQEIISGLDAGADDYLVKPFDPMALLARLRVAQRILAYQRELQQQITEMEALLHRHNLLGEMYGRHGRGKSTTGALPAPDSPLVTAVEVNTMLACGLSEVGLGSAQVLSLCAPPQSDEPGFTAWAPLVLVKEGLWVDLLLEADDASSVAIFELLLGRIPVSERELLDFLAETFNLICTSIKTALTERGCTVLLPIIARSIRSAALLVRPPSLAETSQHSIAMPGMRATVTVLRQFAPVVRKSLGQLHDLDVLSENLPSPSTKEVFLLNQGVVLNARYIEKLTTLAAASGKEVRVPVIKPSQLAEFFCLGRVGNA